MVATRKSDRLRVGLIGVGNISPAYIKGCRAFPILDLVACADLDIPRAERVAAENAIPKAYTVEQLLADPQIDAVINLTVPVAHAAVSLQVIEAGKHVYSEKPLATNLADGTAIIRAAERQGVRVGCAPDTFLFGPHQTCRQTLDQGAIGRVVAGSAFMMSHGPEGWHPNPDFFFKSGGGPMFDMGPYYITCLVNLLGPVKRVSGSAGASFETRKAKDGHSIAVDVPTHYSGTLEFVSGAVITLIITFDVWKHRLPAGMELYGEKGTLTVPDPNGYNPRDVQLFTIGGEDAWRTVSSVYPDGWARGIGLADMAYALQEDRPHRASGTLAYHVLEVMSAFETACQRGTYVTLDSTCVRPEALTVDFAQVQGLV